MTEPPSRLKRTAARRRPGDPDREERVRRMIRVDHAGEYGAKRIYAGQLAVLGRSLEAPTIAKMAEEEERHLAAFERLIAARRVRPTFLQPLWHVAGFALGAANSPPRRARGHGLHGRGRGGDRRALRAPGGGLGRRRGRARAIRSRSSAPRGRAQGDRPRPRGGRGRPAMRSSRVPSRPPRASPSGSRRGFSKAPRPLAGSSRKADRGKGPIPKGWEG